MRNSNPSYLWYTDLNIYVNRQEKHKELYRLLYVIIEKAKCRVPRFTNPVVNIRTPHQAAMPDQPHRAGSKSNCSTCIANPVLSNFSGLLVLGHLRKEREIYSHGGMLQSARKRSINVNKLASPFCKMITTDGLWEVVNSSDHC